jgi:hypothetical protein
LGLCRAVYFEGWSLELFWSLEIGAWSFVRSAPLTA